MHTANTTTIPFTKMHGIGNDFVIVDARETEFEATANQISKLSHRNFGIGCDQFVVISNSANADVAMTIYNQDGSQAEACGNAARCVARFVADRQNKTSATLQMSVGARVLDCEIKPKTVTVNMGPAETRWQRIPCSEEIDTQQATLFAGPDHDILGNATLVNMGNPHCVFFLNDFPLEQFDVESIGATLQNNPLFPKGINVEFVEQASKTELHQRTWERGVGETLACGSGACAVTYAAQQRGKIEGACRIKLSGGSLDFRIDPTCHDIYMTGPTAYSFSGQFEL